jgi:hypothetical protein
VKVDERRKQLSFEARGARLMPGSDPVEEGAEVRTTLLGTGRFVCNHVPHA